MALKSETVVVGLDDLLKKFGEIPDDFRPVLMRNLEAAAIDVMNHAKNSMLRQSKTGREYPAVPGRRAYQASAPGESPATPTGRLAASLRHRSDPVKLEAEAFTDVDYGTHLEFGTMKMEKRPFFAPALAATVKKSLRRIENAIKRRLKTL